VPSAQLRMELAASHPPSALALERPRLIRKLAPALRRQRTAATFAAAG